MGWERSRRFGLLAAGLWALGPGCSPSVYQCAQDQQCGTEGVCEPSGFCSFDDTTCPSGRRYGTFAGSDLGEACVPQLDPSTGDAGSSSTGPPDLESTSGTGASSSSTTDPTTGVVPITEGTSSGSDDSGSSSSSSGAGQTGSTGPVVVDRVEDGLVVFYRLDEGGGETVQDTAPVDPPIDLTLTGAGYAWVDDGLRFTGDSETIAASSTSLTKLNNACANTNEITLEAWVTPASVASLGPPRIVTYSEDASSRNFSLMVGSNVTGEQPPAFRGRLRTDPLLLNGTPEIQVELEAASEGLLAHVAYTHDADGGERMYVDGSLEAEDIRPGDFSVWDTTDANRLGLGNEFASIRPLDGTLHLVAVYCRALQPDEVQQNFDAGI